MKQGGFLPPATEQAAPQQTQLNESDEMDIDIAAGLSAKMMSNEQAIKAITSAFNGSNPTKMLAVFFAQLIEKIQVKSMEMELVINPAVWLAQGGVLDELDDELSDIAEMAGVPYDDGVMPAIKQELIPILQKRADLFRQEQEGAQPQQQGILEGA